MVAQADRKTSRRAVIAGAIGAALASAASAIGRPTGAAAADGQVIVVGGEYASTSQTKITGSGPGPVIAAEHINNGIGVSGKGALAGVYGQGVGSGNAVYGSASDGIGVVGSSLTNNGVRGQSEATNKPAIVGWSKGESIGVMGWSGAGSPPTPRADTGVYGQAGAADGTGVFGRTYAGEAISGRADSGDGVHGTSDTGTGVRGFCGGGVGVAAGSEFGTALTAETLEGSAIDASSGAFSLPTIAARHFADGCAIYGYTGGAAPVPPANTGLYGRADNGGYGVVGETTNGQGVRALATTGHALRAHATSGTGLFADSNSGIALRTKGRLSFEQSSGLATVASGTSSVTVTPGTDLSASSFGLATLNGSAGGATAVLRVAVDSAANTLTIHLTANTATDVKVAWLVLG
jgi:hypothetical protein